MVAVTSFFKTPASARGISLVEILVTLAILALVATFAVPNFRTFVQSNNITASANNLMGSLSLARSEAIKRNMTVSVCASSTHVSCTGVDWDNGWIVFTDSGEDGVVDHSDEILSVVKGLAAGMELSSSAPFIQFKPNGALAACLSCMIDFGRVVVASKMESLQTWLAGMLYDLLPGEEVYAQQFQHQYGKKQNGNNGNGNGNASANDPGPAPSSNNTISNFAGVEFVVCDRTKNGEKGRRIMVSLSGQITNSSYSCN